MRRLHAPRGRLKALTAPTAREIRKVLASGEGRKCRGHSARTGAPCRKYAIRGGTVCDTHGGRAPQVRRAAHERLLALQDPAITRLAQLVDQTEFPSVAITAVKDVLDRTMGRAAETVSMTHAGGVRLSWTGFEWTPDDDDPQKP